MKQQEEMMNLQNILLDPEDKQKNFISQHCKPIKILGKGAFSTVVEAMNMSNKLVAIKIIEKFHFNSQQLDILRQEAQLLIKLSHSNIVRVSFSKETKNKLFIMMDLINGVTLQQFQRNQLDDQTIVCITKQILEAIQYLHKENIIHRDIKPENIMIHPDNLHVTLIDFGLSAQLTNVEGSKLMSENCGTILYMAPEQIQKKKYNRSVDIWALGIVVFNLLHQGKHPFFQEIDDIQSYSEKIKWMKWNWTQKINQKAMSFILKTIAYHPEDRLSVNQCLEHPWITGKDDLPLTFIEILKAHSISNKIKLLIKSVQFLKYLKKNTITYYSPIKNSYKFKQPTTPIENNRFRLNRIQVNKSKNASTSGDKYNKLSNADSASVGSNKISQFKVNIRESKKERNSCDKIQKISQSQKTEQYYLPTLHKSLDRNITSINTAQPTFANTTSKSKIQENLFFMKSNPQYSKDNVKQKQNVSQTINKINHPPKQECISSKRILTSKPPLNKKNIVDLKTE